MKTQSKILLNIFGDAEEVQAGNSFWDFYHANKDFCRSVGVVVSKAKVFEGDYEVSRWYAKLSQTNKHALVDYVERDVDLPIVAQAKKIQAEKIQAEVNEKIEAEKEADEQAKIYNQRVEAIQKIHGVDFNQLKKINDEFCLVEGCLSEIAYSSSGKVFEKKGRHWNEK